MIRNVGALPCAGPEPNAPRENPPARIGARTATAAVYSNGPASDDELEAP